jgi:nucleoside-diphosphate-sugar epimerase
MLGWTYFRSYQMKIIRTRMFAYLNPRRTDLFATSFARQVALIEAGKQKELLHGNLESVRTLIDVRDAMRAYWDTIIHCNPGEIYNIGGPTTVTVGELLEILKKLSKVPIPSRVNPVLLRPADVTLQIPCIKKFVKATGWKAQYTFKEGVEYLLSYWRKKIQ